MNVTTCVADGHPNTRPWWTLQPFQSTDWEPSYLAADIHTRVPSVMKHTAVELLDRHVTHSSSTKNASKWRGKTLAKDRYKPHAKTSAPSEKVATVAPNLTADRPVTEAIHEPASYVPKIDNTTTRSVALGRPKRDFDPELTRLYLPHPQLIFCADHISDLSCRMSLHSLSLIDFGPHMDAWPTQLPSRATLTETMTMSSDHEERERSATYMPSLQILWPSTRHAHLIQMVNLQYKGPPLAVPRCPHKGHGAMVSRFQPVTGETRWFCNKSLERIQCADNVVRFACKESRPTDAHYESPTRWNRTQFRVWPLESQSSATTATVEEKRGIGIVSSKPTMGGAMPGVVCSVLSPLSQLTSVPSHKLVCAWHHRPRLTWVDLDKPADGRMRFRTINLMTGRIVTSSPPPPYETFICSEVIKLQMVSLVGMPGLLAVYSRDDSIIEAVIIVLRLSSPTPSDRVHLICVGDMNLEGEIIRIHLLPEMYAPVSNLLPLPAARILGYSISGMTHLWQLRPALLPSTLSASSSTAVSPFSSSMTAVVTAEEEEAVPYVSTKLAYLPRLGSPHPPPLSGFEKSSEFVAATRAFFYEDGWVSKWYSLPTISALFGVSRDGPLLRCITSSTSIKLPRMLVHKVCPLLGGCTPPLTSTHDEFGRAWQGSNGVALLCRYENDWDQHLELWQIERFGDVPLMGSPPVDDDNLHVPFGLRVSKRRWIWRFMRGCRVHVHSLCASGNLIAAVILPGVKGTRLLCVDVARAWHTHDVVNTRMFHLSDLVLRDDATLLEVMPTRQHYEKIAEWLAGSALHQMPFELLMMIVQMAFV